MSKTHQPLTQLTDHIGGLQTRHTVLKAEIERVTKDLTTLGIKLGDPLGLTRLPIDDEVIEQVRQALKGGGKNVKSLQKLLGVFDYAEMTRKRKALLAAGVTRETENYNGSNATFIELAPETAAPSTEDSAAPDEKQP